MNAAEIDAVGAGAGHAAAAAQPGAGRQDRRSTSPRSAASRCPPETRDPDRAARRRRPRLSRCRSRSSARCCPTTSSRTGARAASAASRSCATAAWDTPCRSTRRTTRSFSSSACKKPAFRIIVNSPTTHGSIGLTTGLDPAMTLGCGGYGGNITSDNISPRHLLNIKRLAYELTPTVSRWDRGAGDRSEGAPRPPLPRRRPSRRTDGHQRRRAGAPDRRLPRLARLQGRPNRGSDQARAGRSSRRPAASQRRRQAPDQTPLDFVCEEDVRLAMQAGRKLVCLGARDRDAGGARSRRGNTASSPSRRGESG